LAAVAVAVAGIFLWRSMDTHATARIHEQSLPAARIQPRPEDMIAYTGKDVVRLPDNTEVTLNSGTILEMTKTFGDSHREVTLRGEAYFDVHHDAAKPFIIRANGVTVKVLGTAFNVRAYPGSKLVKVTVVRGLVQVGSEKQVYSLVRPHEGISVELATNEFTMHDANLTQTLDWRKDFLIFERTSLAEVLTKVDKKYNTHLEVTRYEQLKDCPLTASFSDDASLETVVTAIAQAFGMTQSIASDGSHVTLNDGACP
jgi:ferric-dicitrate binding protein FerR (iron transport regulator)